MIGMFNFLDNSIIFVFIFWTIGSVVSSWAMISKYTFLEPMQSCMIFIISIILSSLSDLYIILPIRESFHHINQMIHDPYLFRIFGSIFGFHAIHS